MLQDIDSQASLLEGCKRAGLTAKSTDKINAFVKKNKQGLKLDY